MLSFREFVEEHDPAYENALNRIYTVVSSIPAHGFTSSSDEVFYSARKKVLSFIEKLLQPRQEPIKIPTLTQSQPTSISA